MKIWLPFILSMSFAHAATGLAPDAAVKALELPPGFTASLVAAEPTITQPIAFEFDDRGRLWVAEFLSYPKWKPEGHDDIVLLGAPDKNGTMQTRSVIWDKGNYVTGFTLGYGGIWVTTPPSLLFIPCDFNADKPVCGTPKVVLDGWSHAGTHNIVNGLQWGPDGWLYGNNGISSRSKIGVPGSPPEKRVYIDGGVWRYHPISGKLEQICTGGTNFWGLDWDANGDMFVTNSVTAHMFHVIPGARFERSHETDRNPHTYELMSGCADHQHYAGTKWQASKLGEHPELGGGHSHVGAFICRGDELGAEFRNSVLMFNTHGNRINRDILETTPTGIVAHHAPDFCVTHDKSFRGVSLKIGPDGALYGSDWHQDGECHSGSEMDSGRIFKFFRTNNAYVQGNISAWETGTIITAMAYSSPRWTYERFMRILMERIAEEKVKPFAMESDREFWDDFNSRRWYPVLASRPERVDEALPKIITGSYKAKLFALKRLAEIAQPSSECVESLRKFSVSPATTGALFLHSVSAIQRSAWAAPFKTELLLSLLPRTGTEPRNGQLMYWYAAEPLVESQPDLCAALMKGPSEKLRTFTARRLSENNISRALAFIEAATPTAQIDILRGIAASLKGRAHVAAPPEWAAIKQRIDQTANSDLIALAQKLAAIFGDQVSLDELRAIVADRAGSLPQRRNALETLLSANDTKLLPVLQKLVVDEDMRGPVLLALARYDDPQTAPQILKSYKHFERADRSAALATLASRASSAAELFAALKKDDVPASDLDSAVVHQLQAHALPELDAWLESHWGQTRPSAEDKQREIVRLKGLSAAGLKTADAARGKLVFAKTCLKCHTLFAEGGKVGPDLTGSARANLDYLLLNVIDPNAIVPQEFMAWNFKTKDGRVLSGLLRNETAESLDVVAAEGTVTLRTEDIKIKKRSSLSVMPEGALSGLKENEIWDLIAYLQSQP